MESVRMALFVFLLLLFPLSAADWIVLRSGKAIRCDRYEREAGKVIIHSGSQAYSLPESMVDWDKSKEKQILEDEKAAEHQRNELEAKARKAESQLVSTPKKKIELFTKDMSTLSASGPLHVPFRLINNSLVVDVCINGGQTFPFILDTGASISTINPNANYGAPLEYSQQKIRLAGVGGNTEENQVVILQSIKLGGAELKRFPMVAIGLPMLSEENIYGLLGQDFLGNYAVNIDNQNRLLTLTPQGQAPTPFAGPDLPMPSEVLAKLEYLIQQVNIHSAHYCQYRQQNQNRARELDLIVAEFTENERHWRAFLENMKSRGADQSQSADGKVLAKMIDCRFDLSTFTLAVQKIAIELAQLYRLDKPDQAALDDFNYQSQRAVDFERRYRECQNR